jgi:hypothetical protein
MITITLINWEKKVGWSHNFAEGTEEKHKKLKTEQYISVLSHSLHGLKYVTIHFNNDGINYLYLIF